QAEDGIRDWSVTGVQTCALPISLADNENQGIVPVPAKLGNGEDPERNLYWGAAGGMKTYFRRSSEWTLLQSGQKPKSEVLERCRSEERRVGKERRVACRRGEVKR